MLPRYTLDIGESSEKYFVEYHKRELQKLATFIVKIAYSYCKM